MPTHGSVSAGLQVVQIWMVTVVASAGTLGAGPAGPQGFQLIWPTVQDIRDSVEGWRGGASVPGPAKNVNKPFLQPYWHRCCPQSRMTKIDNHHCVFSSLRHW